MRSTSIRVGLGGCWLSAWRPARTRRSLITKPEGTHFVGSELDRCQHIASGPVQPDGSRYVFFTHHGDAWGPRPRLISTLVEPTGDVQIVETIVAETVIGPNGTPVFERLYEGLR